MSLIFNLNAIAHSFNPPLPVLITIGWEFLLTTGEDKYFMTIEVASNYREKYELDEPHLYSNITDKTLSYSARYAHIHFLKILKKYRIYIPFTIYESFENANICSAIGICRWEVNRLLVADISQRASQRYPDSSIDEYYDYFVKLINGGGVGAPPLEFMDEEGQEENFDFTCTEGEQPPDFTDIFAQPIRYVDTISKKNNNFDEWKKSFFQLSAIITDHYLDDYKIQESAFVYQVHLFVNNANYSIDEKDRLNYAISPFQNRKKNSYLRTDKSWAIFEKSKDLFKLDKASIFASIGLPYLKDALSHYFNVQNLDSIEDLGKIVGFCEKTPINCIFISEELKKENDIHNKLYKQISQYVSGKNDEDSIESVKQKYIICHVNSIENIYMLCFPNSNKALSDRLNILTSLGFVPNIVTFYRSIFKNFYEKNTVINKNIFYEIFKSLLGSSKTFKFDNEIIADKRVSQIQMNVISDFLKKENFSIKNILNYICFVRNILNETDIIKKLCTKGNGICQFIVEKILENLLIMYRDDNFDSFISGFQGFLEALTLYIDIQSEGFSLNQIIRSDQKNLQCTFICNYAMTAFNNILTASLVTHENKVVEICNQAYFELLNNMDNLHGKIKRIKYLDEVQDDSSIIFVDTHSNNAVESELYSHQIKHLFAIRYPRHKEYLSTGMIPYNIKTTIIIDATLNILNDSELTEIISEVNLLLQEGLLNLIIVQSLTKFTQLGADKFSAGIICVYNNGKGLWEEFNKKLYDLCSITRPDKLIENYFSIFYRYGRESLTEYLNKVNENTCFLLNQLEQFNLGHNIGIEVTANIDNKTCYISLNYRAFTQYFYKRSFISDQDISSFNKNIIELIVDLTKTVGIVLTQRQSIGFPECNINECDFAVRLTVGLESNEQLKNIALIINYVRFALGTGINRLEKSQESNIDYRKYFDFLRDIFLDIITDKKRSDKFTLVQVPIITYSYSVQKVHPNIHVKSREEIKKDVVFVLNNKKLQAEVGCKIYDIYITILDQNRNLQRKNYNDLDIFMKILVILFVYNFSETKCNLKFNGEHDDGDSVIEVTNFTSFLQFYEVDSFTYPSSYGKLKFILDYYNDASIMKLSDGKTLLFGNEIEIHKDVLANFGVNLENELLLDIHENYVVFSSLPIKFKQQIFLKLANTKILFRNTLHPKLKIQVPEKVIIEAKRYLKGNGFHVTYIDKKNTVEYGLSIFAIKQPILNLFCQYVCLLSICEFWEVVPPRKFIDEASFEIKETNINDAIDRFSNIVMFFLKKNREIHEIFDKNSENKSENIEYIIINEILILLKTNYISYFDFLFESAKRYDIIHAITMHMFFAEKDNPELNQILPSSPNVMQEAKNKETGSKQQSVKLLDTTSKKSSDKSLKHHKVHTNQSWKEATKKEGSNTSSASSLFYKDAKNLTIFNYISKHSNLTHQNIDYLLSIAFTKASYTQEQYDNMCTMGAVDIVIISEKESLDYLLRDAILKFIGQEPEQEKASFALCRGDVNPQTNQIEGNTHWTAFHLRRVVNEDQSIVILAYHMDSLGSTIPTTVTRVLTQIATVTLTQLNDDLQQNALYKRAITRIGEDADNQKILFMPCNSNECQLQQDGYSCGYHAIFNMLRMHLANDIHVPQSFTILQDDVTVSIEQFIEERRINLQDFFNKKMVINTSNDLSKNNKVLDDLVSFEVYIAQLFLTIEDDHIEKLKKLIETEKNIKKEGNISNIKFLSKLKIEKLYQKIIMGFIDNIKFGLKQLDIKLNEDDERSFEQWISPINLQDPQSVLPQIEHYQNKTCLILLKKMAVSLSEFKFKYFRTHIENHAKEIMILEKDQFNTNASQSVLAYMYLRGLGLNQDQDEGVKLLTMASDGNYNPANVILFDYYLTVKKDKILKKEYLEKTRRSFENKPESEIPDSLKKLFRTKLD